MPLHFITEKPGAKGPAGEDRRLIRSHVMRRRNAGKTRPSLPSAPVRRVLQRFDCPGCSEPQIARRVHTCACYKGRLDMRRLIWNDLAVVSLPYQLDRKLTGLLHECFVVAREVLYPPKFCAPSNSMVSAWIQFVFHDEAYLQCSLAIVASYSDAFAGQANMSPRTMGYLSRAYKLVNQKLSGPEATSKETIAAVTTLAMYHRVHHLPAIGIIHFEGLRQILRLRGGMAALGQEDRALTQKPWRLDIEFALQDGSPIRFVREDAPPSGFLNRGNSTEQMGKARTVMVSSVSPDLHSITNDIRTFTTLLNNIGEDSKLDALDYAQEVQHLIHRLLQYCSLGSSDQLDPSEHILHVALLALMATLLHEYGSQHSRYDLLSRELREAVQSFRPAESWQGEFQLWALFIGGISVFKTSEDEWLLPILDTTCRKFGLESWDQALERLTRFPWIYAIHDKPGRRLFDIIRRRSV